MNVACLLDTNVLLYLANPAAPEHASAESAQSSHSAFTRPY